MRKIKVLIVDDSAIVRNMLSERISKEPNMEVVATAPDPFVARDKIVMLNPDVMTLDIEMPRMDGLTFLSRIMQYNPMPVIIVSSITTQNSAASIKALELGAFDVVNKPGGSFSINGILEEIIQKINAAFQYKDKFLGKIQNYRTPSPSLLQNSTSIKKERNLINTIATTDKLIAIGASTGGTIALEYIFKNLPQNLPPIVVVQHMPPVFTKQFADRLNELSSLHIQEIEGEELLTPGNVYIAKGGFHMGIKRKGALLYTEILEGERVQFQKPAVDVLFHSVAKTVGQNALGVLLTGMGKDGAEGLLEMKKAGAYTIAQDEKSSIVWGMPKAAIDIQGHCEILELEKIPKKIIELMAIK